MRYICSMVCFMVIVGTAAQPPLFNVADSLYAVKNYHEAIHSYNNIEGSQAKVNLQLARSYHALGLKTKALHYYSKAMGIDANAPIALTEYGLLLLSTRNFRKADSIFKKLTKTYPDNSGYYYQRGRALKELEKKSGDTLAVKRKERSEEIFAQAIALDSTNQKALYELAIYHVKERNYSEAQGLISRGIKNDSLDIEMINLSAQNDYNKGDFGRAIDFFEQLISLGVENEFIHRKLGRSYYEQQFYGLSRGHYEKVLSYNDKDATVHLALARLNNRLMDFEKARNHAEMALRLQDQPLDEIYFTMGRTYELHKEYPEAIKALQKAVKENPENSKAYRAIAICADNYYKDKTEVLALYEQAFAKVTGDDYGAEYTRSLIKERMTALKRELFMEGDEGNE